MKNTTPIRFRRRGRQEGAALILAILCVLILTILGIALTISTQSERDIAANETYVNKAFYGADAGIQYVSAQLRANILFAQTAANPTLAVPINSPHLGNSSGQMQVTMSKPALIGQGAIAGYQFGQWFENIYAETSNASIPNPANAQDRANQTIYAEIGIKPVQAD
jgi:Tfp pilus assembly protein PilX